MEKKEISFDHHAKRAFQGFRAKQNVTFSRFARMWLQSALIGGILAVCYKPFLSGNYAFIN